MTSRSDSWIAPVVIASSTQLPDGGGQPGQHVARHHARVPDFAPRDFTRQPVQVSAAHAASNGASPCASNPTIAPASTSPLPAVASAGLANGSTTARPSGWAMTVNAPFKMTMCPHSAAIRRAMPTRSAPILPCLPAASAAPSRRVRREDGRARETLSPAVEFGQRVERVGVHHQRRQCELVRLRFSRRCLKAYARFLGGGSTFSRRRTNATVSFSVLSPGPTSSA